MATGNDADADRHGIVTPDAGLLAPNAYLAVAIEHLLASRAEWPAARGDRQDAGAAPRSSTGSSRAWAAGCSRSRSGFKWFVPGLLDGSVAFGGEESAGASFLRRDGSVWTTDKDGILLCLLAAEITAAPAVARRALRRADRGYGEPAYARVDAPATPRAEGGAGQALRPSRSRRPSWPASRSRRR